MRVPACRTDAQYLCDSTYNVKRRKNTVFGVRSQNEPCTHDFPVHTRFGSVELLRIYIYVYTNICIPKKAVTHILSVFRLDTSFGKVLSIIPSQVLFSVGFITGELVNIDENLTH